MTDVQIRRAGPADAQALADLGAATFTEAFGHLYPRSDLEDFLAGNHTTGKVAASLADPAVAAWVAEDRGRMVGYSQAGPADMPHADLRPEHGELKRLYILNSHQNLGLGAALIEPALAWMDLERPGAQWISVWSQNEGAQRFYGRYGFRKVGEYQFAVGAWRDDEFIFRRG